MIGLIRAETLKLTGRKLYPVMTLIVVAFTALAGFFLLLAGQIFDGADNGIPVIERPEAFLFGVQQVVGQTWFPLILAAVVLGGEFASTVWATTLTRESRRSWQIGARMVVLVVASWLAMLLGIAVWAGMTFIFASGSGGPDFAGWVGIVLKTGAVQVPWVALGIGLVSLLRSVGPSIGAVLALSFGESLLVLWSAYRNVSLTGATTGIFGGIEFAGVPADFLGPLVGLGHSLLILAGWTVLGLLLTWWGLSRRDA